MINLTEFKFVTYIVDHCHMYSTDFGGCRIHNLFYRNTKSNMQCNLSSQILLKVLVSKWFFGLSSNLASIRELSQLTVYLVSQYTNAKEEFCIRDKDTNYLKCT